MPTPPYAPAHRDYVLLHTPDLKHVISSGRVTSRTPADNGTVSVRTANLTGSPRWRRLPAHRLTLHPLSDFWNGISDSDETED